MFISFCFINPLTGCCPVTQEPPIKVIPPSGSTTWSCDNPLYANSDACKPPSREEPPAPQKDPSWPQSITITASLPEGCTLTRSGDNLATDIKRTDMVDKETGVRTYEEYIFYKEMSMPENGVATISIACGMKAFSKEFSYLIEIRPHFKGDENGNIVPLPHNLVLEERNKDHTWAQAQNNKAVVERSYITENIDHQIRIRRTSY